VIESAVGVVVVTDAVAALQLQAQQQAQCSSDSPPPLQLCGIEAAVRRLLSDDELMATLQQVHTSTLSNLAQHALYLRNVADLTMCLY
jgi:7-keto-8-aminopelargonate synthetase-like enzyme